MSLLAFTPSAAITIGVTTAQGVAIVQGNGHYLRFANAGAGNVYVLFFEPADPVPTVTINAMMIPGGAIEVFSVATDRTQVAYMGDAATTLNVCRGEGQ